MALAVPMPGGKDGGLDTYGAAMDREVKGSAMKLLRKSRHQIIACDFCADFTRQSIIP